MRRITLLATRWISSAGGRRPNASRLVWTAVGLSLIAVLVATAPWGARAETKSGFAIALDGSDSNPCTTSRPCRTFNRAYHVAPSGAAVEVRAGSYGDQLISAPRPAGQPVIFQPAPRASVTLGELRTDSNGAGNFEVRGMTLADAYLASGTHDVTFRNDTMKLFYLRTTTNVSFLGGRVGGLLLSPNSPTIGAADTAPSKNTVIDHVLFHDIRIDPSVVPAQHGECLFVQEADGLVIRNSTFRDCSDFDIYFHQISGGGNPKNVLVENNFFGATTEGGFYTLFFATTVARISPTFDSRLTQPHKGFTSTKTGRSQTSPSSANMYGPSRQCTRGVEYQYNIIQGIAMREHRPQCGDRLCGSVNYGDRGPGQLAIGGNDLHLVRGAKAIGFVPAKTRRPLRDIDGDMRPPSASPMQAPISGNPLRSFSASRSAT